MAGLGLGGADREGGEAGPRRPHPHRTENPMSLSCPVCKSTDVECQKRPHMHRCNTCGYDGTTTAVCTCDGCGGQKWAPMHPDVPNLCTACLARQENQR